MSTPVPPTRSDIEPMGDVDFAIAATREEGEWTLTPLALQFHEASLKELLTGLGRLPSESGVLGLVSVSDDFFAVLRVMGARQRVLISDTSAALEYPLAREILDNLGISDPEDSDDVTPAGDLDIVADLGMNGIDLRTLCEEDEDYPDEMLAQIADQLGFGSAFRDAVEAVSRAE